MKRCCLCLDLTPRREAEVWNRPLAESANFVVLPSLGSLVQGWLLLVPKSHYICTGAFSAELVEEMQQVKRDVAAQLGEKYGSVAAFEHGPGAVQRSIGCGVDHAHVHLVPVDFSLRKAAGPFLPKDVSWSAGGWEQCRAAYAAGQDYLFLEQPLGNGLISVHREFGSQIFRKAIAANLGVPEQFSWREHPKSDLIALTIREFAGALSISSAPPNRVPASR